MKTLKAIGFISGLGTVLSVLLYKFITWAGMMPVAASIEAGDVDRAFTTCLQLTVPIYGFVAATLIYILYEFRAKAPTDQGAKFEHSRGHRVEAIWIVASTALTLGLAIYGIHELKEIRGAPEADLDVQVTASQFSWEFYYPQFHTTGSRLTLPLGKRVRLLLTSNDVIHSFWVPEFRTKQDALPGRVVKLMLTPTRLGTYTLLCNQLCGMDHTIMTAEVAVVENTDFEKMFKAGGAEVW